MPTSYKVYERGFWCPLEGIYFTSIEEHYPADRSRGEVGHYGYECRAGDDYPITETIRVVVVEDDYSTPIGAVLIEDATTLRPGDELECGPGVDTGGELEPIKANVLGQKAGGVLVGGPGWTEVWPFDWIEQNVFLVDIPVPDVPTEPVDPTNYREVMEAYEVHQARATALDRRRKLGMK